MQMEATITDSSGKIIATGLKYIQAAKLLNVSYSYIVHCITYGVQVKNKYTITSNPAETEKEKFAREWNYVTRSLRSI